MYISWRTLEMHERLLASVRYYICSDDRNGENISREGRRHFMLERNIVRNQSASANVNFW